MDLASPLVSVFTDSDTSSIIILFLSKDQVLSLLPLSKTFYKSSLHSFFKPCIQDKIRQQAKLYDSFVALCREAEGLAFTYLAMDFVFGRWIVSKELRRVEYELSILPCLEEDGNSIYEIHYIDSKMFCFTFGGVK